MPKVTFIDLPEDILKQASLPVTNADAHDKAVCGWLASESNAFQFFKRLLTAIRMLFLPKNLPVNLLAFLLGRASIMGEIAPFGLAFFAAAAATTSSRGKIFSIGLWALAGLLSSGKYWEGGVYVVSMLLYWRFSDKINRFERKAHVLPFFFLSAVLLAGMAVLPWREANLYGIIIIMADAIFCLALIYIFQYGMPLVLGKNKTEEKMTEQFICLILMLAIGVAGLNGVVVFGLNLNNIVGCLVILALAMICGGSLGAAAGVVIGLANSLNGNDSASSIAIYSLAGLLGGVFREFGKSAIIFGFLMGNIIFLLYFEQKNMLAGQLSFDLIEPALAGAIFFATPVKVLLRAGKEHFYGKEEEFLDKNRQPLINAVDKLNYIAELLGGISETAHDASSKEQSQYRAKIKESQLNEMFAIVGNKVCDPCNYRNECWDKGFYPVYQSMLEMLALAERRELTAKSVPLPIKSYCAQKDVLVDVINQVVERNRTHWYWQKKLTECRYVSAEQLKATASIVANLAQEIKSEPKNDLETAQRLKYQSEELCCPLSDVRVTGNGNMVSVKVQKEPCQNNKECVNTILPLTANLLKEPMNIKYKCGDRAKNKFCRIVMDLAERYRIEIGKASVAKGDDGKLSESVCGDAYAHFSLGQGKEALILSDGMGSGSLAAGESNATVEFLKKLLTAGFDVDIAVKTVNSMLLLRTPAESFATVDMAIIDAYTCETKFLKIGAAPSFIKRVREVYTINSSAIPAGIIEQIEIEPIKKILVPGDIIIMVSDGILERGNGDGNGKENWIVNYLRRLSTENPKEIAASILHQARTLSGNIITDDMTVMVAKIAEREMF